ncbi:MAG: hypothetical protein HYS65_01855 [Betaproteobacteria bacterium]|nr:hypothetical protein [Betaproteobacteria bacterium]MBI2293105.1 hypothetical protein [Betaproteobacteria bacterium]
MKTSRTTQQWILDGFLKVEDVFSYRFNFLLEWGFKHADLRRTVDRIRAFAMIPKEWDEPPGSGKKPPKGRRRRAGDRFLSLNSGGVALHHAH